MPDSTPHLPEIEVEPADSGPRVNLNKLFLGGLLGLAVLTTCYVAAEIILPIVLAYVLNLVLQPVLRVLQRVGLPQTLAALAIVLSLVGLFVVLGYLLSGPVSSWLTDLPQMAPRLVARLSFLSEPLTKLQSALERLRGLAPGSQHV